MLVKSQCCLTGSRLLQSQMMAQRGRSGSGRTTERSVVHRVPSTTTPIAISSSFGLPSGFSLLGFLKGAEGVPKMYAELRIRSSMYITADR